MNEVLHANIFFVIASVATVIFFTLVCFVVYQVYKIMKLIRSVMEKVESTSEILAGDIAHIREMLANGGLFGRLINFILGAVSTQSRRKNKSRD